MPPRKILSPRQPSTHDLRTTESTIEKTQNKTKIGKFKFPLCLIKEADPVFEMLCVWEI
jgi:hypothetical protein